MTARRHAVYRSKHGKTIRVCVTLSGEKIVGVTFTGDFFGEPAESFSYLGNELIGLTINDKEEIIKRIEEFFKKNVVWLAGASPEDFKTALMKSLET